MVIRDLTLRSAASFGSFHLIRLLYDEYMFYLVEHRVAEATGETPIAVMGEVSAPPTPGQEGRPQGPRGRTRGARVWGVSGWERARLRQSGDTGRPWLLCHLMRPRAGCPACRWQNTQNVTVTSLIISQ